MLCIDATENFDHGLKEEGIYKMMCFLYKYA